MNATPSMSIAKDARIYVAGHRGLVGAALVRRLEAQGYDNLLTRTHRELDLVESSAVAAFFDAERPDYMAGYSVAINPMPTNLYGSPPLRDGIERTYRWFLSHQSDVRA